MTQPRKATAHFKFAKTTSARSQTLIIFTYMAEIPAPLNVYDTHWSKAFLSAPQRPAGLPVPNSTHSYWLHPSSQVNPLAKEGSEGPLTQDADICIVGAGITGVSAAYHFANALSGSGSGNLKVVILEARDFCALL